MSISIVFLLASCSFTRYNSSEFPYGKWHSTDPDLTIDIGLEYNDTQSYFGTYVKDGEGIDVLVYMSYGGTLEIHDFEEYNFSEDHWDYRDKYGNIKNPPPQYFDGAWRPVNIFDGKLRYKLDDDYREATGYRVIVFEKIESREWPTDILIFEEGNAYKYPYGLWQSEEPHIVLDINRNPQEEFKGVYGADAPLDVTVEFFWKNNDYDNTEMRLLTDSDYIETLLRGLIHEEGDKLLYELTDNDSNPIGKTIVFKKMREYELPASEPDTYKHPGEVWRSDDPAITINVDPENDDIHYLGSYEKDGERIGVVAVWRYAGGDGDNISRALKIYDGKNYVFWRGKWAIANSNPIFIGICETDGDEMRLTQIPPWRNMTGYEEIVFKKSTIEDGDAASEF
ncbi:MAG: hypothetical protein LBK57_01445 [Clostridiales Family XIII bacterium]|nr:hypothetical protein [Clostridiales Family XIII bacterium]